MPKFPKRTIIERSEKTDVAFAIFRKNDNHVGCLWKDRPRGGILQEKEKLDHLHRTSLSFRACEMRCKHDSGAPTRNIILSASKLCTAVFLMFLEKHAQSHRATYECAGSTFWRGILEWKTGANCCEVLFKERNCHFCWFWETKGNFGLDLKRRSIKIHTAICCEIASKSRSYCTTNCNSCYLVFSSYKNCAWPPCAEERIMTRSRPVSLEGKIKFTLKFRSGICFFKELKDPER